MKRFILFVCCIVLVPVLTMGQVSKDIFETESFDLETWFVGHGSLMFSYNGLNIHVDPFSRVADYSQLPKADLILITHEHQDHLDTIAINLIRKDDTKFVLTPTCYNILNEGFVLANNESLNIAGLLIESVPAYNVVHLRNDGQPYHPRGIGNGYIINFGEFRVYVAGDTEDIPEMKKIKNIDVAFLPMNLPFTMTPEMVANAAMMIRPKVLYPYHFRFGQTNLDELEELLEYEEHVEVRIRNF